MPAIEWPGAITTLRELTGATYGDIGKVCAVTGEAVRSWSLGLTRPNLLLRPVLRRMLAAASAAARASVDERRRIAWEIAGASIETIPTLPQRRRSPGRLGALVPKSALRAPSFGKAHVEYIGHSRPRVQVKGLEIPVLFCIWLYRPSTKWALIGQGTEYPFGSATVEWCLPIPPVRYDAPATDVFPSLDGLRSFLRGRFEGPAAFSFRAE